MNIYLGGAVVGVWVDEIVMVVVIRHSESVKVFAISVGFILNSHLHGSGIRW